MISLWSYIVLSICFVVSMMLNILLIQQLRKATKSLRESNERYWRR